MKLFEQVHRACRAKHYSPRTEEDYTRWIERFLVDSGTQRSFRRWCEGNSYYVPGIHPVLKQENTKNEDLTPVFPKNEDLTPVFPQCFPK